MKITKQQLKKLIKEEYKSAFNETGPEVEASGVGIEDLDALGREFGHRNFLELIRMMAGELSRLVDQPK